MKKTTELATIIAPGVGIGLISLFAAGVLPAACLADAAMLGAALLLAVAVASASVDVFQAWCVGRRAGGLQIAQ
jgi:hypothetical protein